MKIIVLHGDDERKLYERLSKFVETAKSRSWEVSYLDDPSVSIPVTLSSTSLFTKERFFILRDIKKIGKSEIDWIKKNSQKIPGNLIIYHEGYVPVAITKGFSGDLKIEEFKLPKLIFSFLDTIYPGNATQIIKTLHKVVETQAIEFVFALIAKHLRDLYWVKTEPGNTNFPSWKISKLKFQASKFTNNSLKEIISRLSEIDIEVKTSNADLLSELDLLIIKQLE